MLSSRAQHIAANGSWARGKRSLYHPDTNPEGNVPFHNAENWLVHEEMINFINSHNTFPITAVGYHEGFTGTSRLRSAMATHMNAHFSPVQPVDAEHLTFGCGVTEINEVCAMLTCDHGKKEAVMLGRPIYGSFKPDMAMRTGVELEFVSFEPEVDQFDVGCVAAYEKAIEDARARGITVKALLLCNPHNPLGQCYTRNALVALLRFCGKHNIHLVSDEIYALSVFNLSGRSNESFTSVLSIDWTDLIDENQVHVLYGLSKDFGACGLRLGCVYSRNDTFNRATWAMCRFASPSELTMHVAACMLEDQAWVRQFIAIAHSRLAHNRNVAEELFRAAGVGFHELGNAGFFLWIDLRPWLPIKDADGDEWEAEILLSKRFDANGVWMAYGRGFEATEAGRFRVIFGVREDSLREGIKRILDVAKVSEDVTDDLRLEVRLD